MAGERRPTPGEGTTGTSPSGGHRRRGRSPSRGFYIGMAAVLMLALFLAAVGAISAQSSSGGGPGALTPLPGETPIPIEVTVIPPAVTPEPDYTWFSP